MEDALQQNASETQALRDALAALQTGSDTYATIQVLAKVKDCVARMGGWVGGVVVGGWAGVMDNFLGLEREKKSKQARGRGREREGWS